MVGDPQTTYPQIEVKDIYMRNNVLTCDALEDGKPTMFNLGVGGHYAHAVMLYIERIAKCQSQQ